MILIWVLLFYSTSWGSTHPLTGSSVINQVSNSLVFSQMGFTIAAVPNNWNYLKHDSTDEKLIELGTDRTLLSFRSEDVSVKTDLETYVRHYLRDYNQYGFEVSGLQSHSKSLVPSVIVDLNQKSKATKSRQVFFYKNGHMIIATCTDVSENFDKTISLCNQILGSFQWRK